MLSEHHSYLDAMLRLAGPTRLVHINAVHYLPFVSGRSWSAPMVGTLHTPADTVAGVGAGARQARPAVVPYARLRVARQRRGVGRGVVDEVIHNGVDLTRLASRGRAVTASCGADG